MEGDGDNDNDDDDDGDDDDDDNDDEKTGQMTRWKKWLKWKEVFALFFRTKKSVKTKGPKQDPIFYFSFSSPFTSQRDVSYVDE